MKRWIFILLLCCCAPQASSQMGLQVRIQKGEVCLSWSGFSGPVPIFRSTSPLVPESLSEGNLPVAHMVSRVSRYHDRDLAQGVNYYYLLRLGKQWLSAGPVQLPAWPLARSRQPWLRVNKARYVLSVMDGQKLLKSYPIALGRNPIRRKLRSDNATTPEGRYRLTQLQPQATYHRAFDLNYPNEADCARHQLLAPGVDIGGEIQIHGCGIGRNWTFGCLAMRDEDIDELFAHGEICAGTRVWIYGGELTLQDLESDARAGEVDRMALGRQQKRMGLAVTCLMDVAFSLRAMPSARPVCGRRQNGNNRPAEETLRRLHPQ